MNVLRNVSLLALVAIAVFFARQPATADPAAGAACAAKLSKDGKAIYSASMAKKPAPNTYQRIVEDETTLLVKDHQIRTGEAVGNGMAAGECVKSAVQ